MEDSFPSGFRRNTGYSRDLDSLSPVVRMADGPRLTAARRSTEPARQPSSTSFSQDSKTLSLPLRQRASSPFSRSHLRSRSSASGLTAPAMTRAHSMPVVDGAGRVLMSTASARPSSPLSPGRRYRSPSRISGDEIMPWSGGYHLSGVDETVPEDSELDSTPRASETSMMPISPSVPLLPSNTFPRRYRPASPLRAIGSAPTSGITPSTPTSSTSSPSLASNRYNEAYPLSHSYQVSFSSNSSLPSTPTSTRSRSPSISSLETIPDSPDAEEAALEAERIAMLKAAADAADSGNSSSAGDQRRKSSLSGTTVFSFGAREKNKRWSVCGAERRGDLDLETIWED